MAVDKIKAPSNVNVAQLEGVLNKNVV